MVRGFGAVAALGLVHAACGDPGTGATPPCRSRDCWQTVADLPARGNRAIDLLYVIDDSGSMGEEQTTLTACFGDFLGVFGQFGDDLPDVHIGVVSSDAGAGGYAVGTCEGDGDGGRLQNTPAYACAPPQGRFISDVLLPDGTREKNYTGTLSETLACISMLGTDGCGLEQHLESMKRALDGSNPENAGFLRDDALLAVVFLTDEDDCSASDAALFDPDPALDAVASPLGPLSFRCTEYGIMCDGEPIGRTAAEYSPPGTCAPRADSPYVRHPEEYVEFLRALKPNPARLLVGGIIGNATPVTVTVDAAGKPELAPSCSEVGAGEAAPAVRLSWFLSQFATSSEESICQNDYTNGVVRIAGRLQDLIGHLCLDGAIVDDPATPERDCEAFELVGGVETPLPDCATDGAARPCWALAAAPEYCPLTATQLELVVQRDEPVSAAARVRVRCLVGSE